MEEYSVRKNCHNCKNTDKKICKSCNRYSAFLAKDELQEEVNKLNETKSKNNPVVNALLVASIANSFKYDKLFNDKDLKF